MQEYIDLKGFALNRAVFLNGEQLLPDKSLKLRHHSPDGFNWGYGGSGPTQLSLAILLEILPEEKALELYQEFKWAIIANLTQESFSVRVHIQKFLKSVENEEKLPTNELFEYIGTPFKEIRKISE